MEIRQLRYFAAVARERNFTKAAEHLHMAQPPLSRQVQQLEDELGVTLIDRSSRPLNLTEAGRFFYDQALQLIGRLDQLAGATRRIAHSERRILTIGFVASTLYSGLPEMVRRIRLRWPELDVQLVEMMSILQISAIKEGRIDIGFGRVRFEDAEVKRIVIREERLVAAIPPGHELAGADGLIRLEALGDEALIVYPSEPRPSFADEVLSLLADHGARPRLVHEVRELQTALGLVAAGIGVCVVPASARHLRSGDVRYRTFIEERATSPIILSYGLGDRSGLIEDIKELILETYRDLPE